MHVRESECVVVHIYVYICIFVCVYVCMYVCMHICVWGMCVFTTHFCVFGVFVCVCARMNVNTFAYVCAGVSMYDQHFTEWFQVLWASYYSGRTNRGTPAQGGEVRGTGCG